MYRANIYNIKTVVEAIKTKYGIEEIKNYKPNENCLTFNAWRQKGYSVNKGEKSIKIITFIQDKEKNKTFPKTCNLFYIKQVSKIKQ